MFAQFPLLIGVCLSILCGLFISIGALVYLIKIRSDTKVDTFQQPFQPGQKDKLFTFYSNITSANIGIKCELYERAILNPKVKKLGDVFYLNIESIHTRSTQLLILYVVLIVYSFLTILSSIYCLEVIQSFGALCFACLIFLGNFSLLILSIVLYILMILSFYKGDTQRFIEYLSCANVNREEFGNYLFAEKLNRDFKIFIILHLISLFLSYNSNRNKNKNKKINENRENSEKNEKTQVIGIKVDN